MKIKTNLRVRRGDIRFLELSVECQYGFLYGAQNADANKLRIFLIRRITFAELPKQLQTNLG
jgi:hypothetical protein